MRHNLLKKKLLSCLMATMLLGTSFSQAAWATETSPTDPSQDNGLTAQNASDSEEAQSNGGNSGGIDSSSRFAEGQALVVYHTSSTEDAGSGISPFFSLRSQPEDTLVTEGFTVEESFDLSKADSIATENAAVGKYDALSARSFDDTPDSNSDVRVALVSKKGDSTESLLTELGTLSCVEACAPNYYYPYEGACPSRNFVYFFISSNKSDGYKLSTIIIQTPSYQPGP